MVAEETVDVWIPDTSPCGLFVSWQSEHVAEGVTPAAWQTWHEGRVPGGGGVVALA